MDSFVEPTASAACGAADTRKLDRFFGTFSWIFCAHHVRHHEKPAQHDLARFLLCISRSRNLNQFDTEGRAKADEDYVAQRLHSVFCCRWRTDPFGLSDYHLSALRDRYDGRKSFGVLYCNCVSRAERLDGKRDKVATCKTMQRLRLRAGRLFQRCLVYDFGLAGAEPLRRGLRRASIRTLIPVPRTSAHSMLLVVDGHRSPVPI